MRSAGLPKNQVSSDAGLLAETIFEGNGDRLLYGMQ